MASFAEIVRLLLGHRDRHKAGAPDALALSDLSDPTGRLLTPREVSGLRRAFAGGPSDPPLNADTLDGFDTPLPFPAGGTGQTTKQAAFDALSPLTAKGQFIAHDGTNNVRHSPDVDGRYLVTDALGVLGQTTGLGWTIPRLSMEAYRMIGATHNRRFLAGMVTGQALTAGAPTIDTLYAVPYLAASPETLDLLDFEVTAGGAKGSVSRAGIYDNVSATDVRPGSLLVDGGEHVTTTTGVKSSSISQALTMDRLYWFAFLCGTSAPTIRLLNPVGMCAILGLPSTWGTAPGVGWTAAQAYGALPASFPASPVVHATFAPAIGARRSA